MDIAKLFTHRDALAHYPVNQFAWVAEDVGVRTPIVFLIKPDSLRTTAQLTINKLADVVFDLHVIYDAASAVVAYVIDTKYPRTTSVWANGVGIKQTVEHARERARVKYSFDEFQIVTNDAATAVVFARNLTSDQKT